MTKPGLGTLVDSAIGLLDRTRGFIDTLSDEQYRAASLLSEGASIGQHVRHLSDHFASLALAHSTGAIAAYDQRSRGTDVETSRDAARARLATLRDALAQLDEPRLAAPVHIRVLPAPDAEEVEIPTTLARELAFVTHHGVHHHALMKVIARELGVEAAASFGRAPSTIKAETKR